MNESQGYYNLYLTSRQISELEATDRSHLFSDLDPSHPTLLGSGRGAKKQGGRVPALAHVLHAGAAHPAPAALAAGNSRHLKPQGRPREAVGLRLRAGAHLRDDGSQAGADARLLETRCRAESCASRDNKNVNALLFATNVQNISGMYLIYSLSKKVGQYTPENPFKTQ